MEVSFLEAVEKDDFDLFEQRNMDGSLTIFPVIPGLLLQSSYIFNAHKIIRVVFQHFLEFKDTFRLIFSDVYYLSVHCAHTKK